MRYKLKNVFDDQILKTQKFQGIFLHHFLPISCTPVARLYDTTNPTTQVSETVFVSLFSACSNSQSSHLSPKCFPILLIRTIGVLPTLFRMLGRIFGGSGLAQTQTKSQCTHTTTTQHLLLFISTSFLLYQAGYFSSKEYPLDIHSIRSSIQNMD